MTQRSNPGLTGFLLTLLLLSCAPTPTPPVLPQAPTEDYCNGVDFEAKDVGTRVNAALTKLALTSELGTLPAEYIRQNSAFTDLTKKLCHGSPTNAPHLATCASVGIDALAGLEHTLELASNTATPELSWVIEAKIFQLEEAALCQSTDAVTMGQVAIDTRGLLALKTVHLQTKGALRPTTVKLKAKLTCQIKKDEQFEDVADCNHAQVNSFDKFQVVFETNVQTHIYLLIHNGSGQFQTLFPGKGVPNQVTASTQFTLPAPDDWWQFDQASETLFEHIQIIASAHPVAELERLRGLDFSPKTPKRPPRVAQRARGKMEPLIARSFKIGTKEMVVLPGGLTKPGSDLAITGEEVVGVEFVVEHRP